MHNSMSQMQSPLQGHTFLYNACYFNAVHACLLVPCMLVMQLTSLRLCTSCLNLCWQSWVLLLQMRNDGIATSLMVAASDLLASNQAQPNHDQQTSLAASATPHTPALTDFADDIVTRRSKMLQQQLGSTVRHRVNAALHLLVAIASMGGSVTAHLLRSLDTTSDAFSKLTHPPK